MSKVLKYGLLVAVLIFLFLLLAPWLFKDEIFKKVQEEANENLKGELVIGDLSLSLIRNFPNLSMNLSELKYSGDETFQGVELFQIEAIKTKLDLMSVLSGDKIHVLEISIVQPTLDIRVLEDGLANYHILKESEEEEESQQADSESSPFDLGIDSFSIIGLDLSFDDASANMQAKVENGNLSLTGNFTETVVDIESSITVDGLTVAMDNINYLTKTAVQANLDASYNQETAKLELGENKVALNKLSLMFNGWIQTFDDKIALDLNFESPNTAFKEILSLVPAVYMNDFDNVETFGNFAVNGNVLGNYFFEGDDLPGFDINMNVSNGKFKYPDLPASVNDINISTHISHTQGSTDKTVVNIANANASIAGNPFYAKALLKTPISDPDIDFELKTTLDLGKLQNVVPIEGSQYSGVLWTDLFVKGKQSHFENEQYNMVKAGGWLAIQNMRFADQSLNDDILIDTAYAKVSPQELNMPILALKVGESDFTGSAHLKEMLAYALSSDTLRGSMKLKSSFINVNELMQVMVEDDNEATAELDSNQSEDIPRIPDNLDLNILADADRVLYDNIDITNLTGKVRLKDSKAILDNFEMDILQGRLKMSGEYATPSELPIVAANLALQSIDAKAAFSNLNTIQAFAPVAQSTSGSFTSKFRYKGNLNKDLSPDLKSIQAKGNLYTLGLIVQPEIMKTVASLLNSTKYEKVRFEDADLSFEINEGKIQVSPVKLVIGDLKAEFKGTHGLDQTLDYNLKTDVPIDKIDLPKEIAALGLVKGTIPVEFKIGGTMDKPTVKPVFGEATGVKEIITDIIDNVVEEVKDSAINIVNKEAEKIMADAKEQADELMRKAVEEAAKLKAEADKQAKDLKAEARKQADKIKAEAKGDPFKEIAANAAAEKLIKEADKQIDSLQKDANAQADQIIVMAQQEADRIMKEAEEKAKINK